MTFLEIVHDHVERRLFVVKGDDQQVLTFVFEFFHSAVFLQDRTYPAFGVSGRTAGHGQLNDSLLGQGQSGKSRHDGQN